MVSPAPESNAGLHRPWPAGHAFVALVRDDQMALYDATVRIIDPGGAVVADFPAGAYLDHIVEKDISYSYAKAAYLPSAGSSDGMYRAGPMARVNAAGVAGTEQTGRLMEKFRSRFGQVAQETLAQHFARYISAVYAIERARADPGGSRDHRMGTGRSRSVQGRGRGGYRGSTSGLVDPSFPVG